MSHPSPRFAWPGDWCRCASLKRPGSSIYIIIASIYFIPSLTLCNMQSRATNFARQVGKPRQTAAAPAKRRQTVTKDRQHDRPHRRTDRTDGTDRSTDHDAMMIRGELLLSRRRQLSFLTCRYAPGRPIDILPRALPAFSATNAPASPSAFSPVLRQLALPSCQRRLCSSAGVGHVHFNIQY